MHHGRESMAARKQGGWSHCVTAGKPAEKNDGARQDLCGTQFPRMLLSTFMGKGDFSSWVTLSGAPSQTWPEVCLLDDSIQGQLDNEDSSP